MPGKSTISKPRIGIVGFGRMVEVFHLPELRKAGWQVEAAMDITASRRDLAARMGVPNVYSSMLEFLGSDTIGSLDAVLVSTHSAIRRDVTRPLAKRRLHLLIEKPLAITAREAESICKDCEAAGVLLSVHHNRRFDPDMLNVKKVAVSAKFIGEIFYVENRYFTDQPSYTFGAADYDQEWRISAGKGGGVMLDWGPHYVDQVLTLLAAAGRVVWVSADIRNIKFGSADDHFIINMVFENGARALIGKSDICPVAPSNNKWLVIGDNGSLVCEESGKLIAENSRGKRKILKSIIRPKNILRNFREAVHGKKGELLVTGRESLRTIQIFEAARRSVQRGGQSVRVTI